MFLRAVGFIVVAAGATCCFAEQMLTPDNGLQALDKVEQTLHKILSAKTDKALLKMAAPVVDLVDKTVQEVESGRLTKNASSEKVLFAIKALQGLQGQMENGSKIDKVNRLQKQLAEKKVELAKEEGLLKVEVMQKELAEKKRQLAVLKKEKDAAASHQKENEDMSQEESMVAGLLNMAHDLAVTKSSVNVTKPTDAKPHEAILMKSTRINASNTDAGKNKSLAATAKTGVPKALQSIITSLQDRAHNLSADLNRMDADEKMRENELDKLAGKQVPTTGSTDAINKGLAMIKQLKKKEQRSYKKARAMRQSQLSELNAGIRAVEKGDVAGLTSLMGKIQTEMKTLGSSAKGFLH